MLEINVEYMADYHIVSGSEYLMMKRVGRADNILVLSDKSTAVFLR